LLLLNLRFQLQINSAIREINKVGALVLISQANLNPN